MILNEHGKFITKFEFSTKFLISFFLPFVKTVLDIFWCFIIIDTKFNVSSCDQFYVNVRQELCFERASMKLIIFKLRLTVISSSIVRMLTLRYLSPDYHQKPEINKCKRSWKFKFQIEIGWNEGNGIRNVNKTTRESGTPFVTSTEEHCNIEIPNSNNRIFMHD